MFTKTNLISIGLFNASFFLLYFIRTRKKEKKIQDLTASMSYENKYKEKFSTNSLGLVNLVRHQNKRQNHDHSK